MTPTLGLLHAPCQAHPPPDAAGPLAPPLILDASANARVWRVPPIRTCRAWSMGGRGRLPPPARGRRSWWCRSGPPTHRVQESARRRPGPAPPQTSRPLSWPTRSAHQHARCHRPPPPRRLATAEALPASVLFRPDGRQQWERLSFGGPPKPELPSAAMASRCPACATDLARGPHCRKESRAPQPPSDPFPSLGAPHAHQSLTPSAPPPCSTFIAPASSSFGLVLTTMQPPTPIFLASP